MSRRKYIIGSGIVLISAISVGLWLYWGWLFDMYPEHAIIRETGIKNFVVISKIHNDYEWYATIHVQGADAQNLLQKFPFKQGFNAAMFNGKVYELPVTDCPRCFFYLNLTAHDRAYHPYDYVFYLLDTDRAQLTVYEVFGT